MNGAGLRPMVACIGVCLLAQLACTVSGAETNVPLIDFSHAGFGGGGKPLPFVPGVLLVKPGGTADDTALLQAALDRAATLPVDAEGFRGAVQLTPGRFRVTGQLRLRSSGVVLRGSMRGDER